MISPLLVALVAAVPALAVPAAAPQTTPTPATGNIFAGKQIYANPYYASEIQNLAIPSLAPELKTKAANVAKVGSFAWLDTRAKVPSMDTYLANIKKANAAGSNPPTIGAFVVYNLPDRDCAALASNGELSIANNGVALYQGYIDSIAAIIKKYPDISIALVIEPDSLGNMITNMNVQKCANAATAYKQSIQYAMKTLNFSNVKMYLDAGHAGWLGWPANLQPAANIFAEVYNAAGKPAAVRGLATNVANYNAFNAASCPSYTQGNNNCDENRYINAFAPLLTAAGFPAKFIVDTGRSGRTPTGQQQWGDWCNVKGTGFGVRPTTNTGNSLVDSFVWVKPGGESDGTSNSTAVRFDSTCVRGSAVTPAPEAGTWFQAYFEQLLVNANPSF
ncbi:Proteasome activator complex subunit 4 [Sphaceloma murrayae]|uniref:Glucanase n=1 Tax=Sphaceloma murrayae TaxID=2082308 RepID=A0A2K1QTT3_9PEZI|nr:Proteasome activator complex subunit 4 [Sphaceloma murrayae]